MQVHTTYPERKSASFWKRNRLTLLRSLFLLAGYACGLINLLIGGMPWSLIVAGGLCVIWIAFIYRPLVENTLIKKLCDVSIVVCLYLFLLGAVLGGDWGELVGTIVFFADLAAIGFFYLTFFKKQKRNFLPLFELIFVGLVLVLISLLRSRSFSWDNIVLAGVSLGILLLTWALFPREILLESRKKFHR